jgi:hypothetical protein
MVIDCIFNSWLAPPVLSGPFGGKRGSSPVFHTTYHHFLYPFTESFTNLKPGLPDPILI